MNAIEWGALLGLLLLLFLVFVMIRPSISRSRVFRARQRLIEQIEARRGSRVIVMIERLKIVSFLGMPVSRSLDIDDPAEVVRTICFVPSHKPIDLIVHTTGALALAAAPIANALVRHKAPVTLMVPHYAMCGGTRLALASDKILMSPSALLGPETCPPSSQPALGVLESLAEVLSDGWWTHHAPLTLDIARELGMAVSGELPDEAYRLVDLYPQVVSPPPLVQPGPILSGSDDAHVSESENGSPAARNKPGPPG